MTDRARRIADNLARVQRQIESATRRSGRVADAVKLLAVTKYVDAADAGALVAAGCHDLGESRPQELWAKAESFTAESLTGCPVHWHLIGHMQRNKVRRTLPLISMLQSLDSIRLATTINTVAAELDLRIPVLIEVNVSGDAAKHGFAPDELPSVLPDLAACRHLDIRGLMTMAALEGGVQRARTDFQRLRVLRDRWQANCPDTVELKELSMGMSGDYVAAIEEGATIVRVGSALFEGLSS